MHQGRRASRLTAILAALAFLPFAAAQSCDEQAELLFTFWGSPQEKTAIESMVETFNAEHPCITVETQHIPSSGYTEKISTMLAAGDPPDVAYLDSFIALPWAEAGRLLDLTDYFQNDPDAGRLESTFYRYGDDQILGTNTAAETMVMYYRKDLFDEAGVAYPPSDPDDAWTWDEFVEVAKELTVDRNGNRASSPDFDPNAIRTYGVAFPRWWAGYLPFIYSNGGRFASEDGTRLMLNEPEAVEVLQAMQDLIYLHHVAPTPSQAQAMPSTDVMMQSGQVAMDINGHWKTIDYSALPMDWDVAVLPKFDEPATVAFGAPTVIFADTEYPDAAFEFYKFHNDPSEVDLFAKGLWMPLQAEYYTDPEMTATWLEGIEGVYPSGAQGAFVDYTWGHTSNQPPEYWLRNLNEINNAAVNPAMDLIWSNELTAQEAMDRAVEDAEGLMQGRWTD